MESLKQLKVKRSQIKSQLTRFKTFFGNIGATPDLAQLENRYSLISNLLAEFNDTQNKIEYALVEQEAEATPEVNLEQEKERETFENSYYNAISAVDKFLADKKSPPASITAAPVASNSSVQNDQIISNNQTPNVKLPTLNLPSFNGQYDRWLEFADTFKSLIHTNNSISDIQKFYYLRSSLKDEAAIVINAIEVSSANYTVAWQLLQERFENKRIIIHNHVKGLFELPHISKESSTLLRQLLDNVSRHVRSLTVLGQTTQHWDTLLIYLITSKLDPTTRREWEASKFSSDLPTMAEITSFLRNKCELLETLQVNKHSIKIEYHNPKSQRIQSNSYITTTSTCAFCKGEHSIYNCSEFATLPVTVRTQETKKLRLCINCLRKQHHVRDCRSNYRCRKCSRKHNTLLHVDYELEDNNSVGEVVNQQVAGTPSPQVIPSSSTTIANHVINHSSSQILLSTALIEVRDIQGKIHESRVLLDSGSQSNFITDKMCQILNLRKQRVNSTVAGINQTMSNINYKTDIKLQSRHNGFKATVSCLILPNITANLPPISFDSSSLSIPQNIKLADPGFNKTGTIDILLGASIFWELMCIGQIQLGKNQPILQKTQFGWVIGGSMSIPQNPNVASYAYCSINANKTVENQIERFWEIEEVQAISKFSKEERACEINFVETTKRTDMGRFEVSIPLRDNQFQLGESRNMALKRLFSLEKKLNREPKLKHEYTKFMADYENLGHMSRIQENNLETQLSYYLPHHAVIKNSSTTTKVRVVFDASAKSSSNISLNDIQLVGPTIQNDLFSILLRYRKHAFVLTADIEKMYRQILLKPEHRSLHRILWRSHTSQPVQCYELKTVTYGSSSSAFLAIRCLYQLGVDFEASFPRESCIIKNDFYVDDLLTGANSVEELASIKNNVSTILETAGFKLRKWGSNKNSVLSDRCLNDIGIQTELIDICKELETKTLGILWNSTADTFQYAVKNLIEKHVTKRTILSETAQIYDPLGLIGPITITAKIIIQKLWQYKLSWDESIPLNLYTTWSKFRNQLKLINQLTIPRHVLVTAPILIELHGFCDSSETAYGACLYIRSINASKEISVKLLCAKSKVAPLKTVTLQRLELCGALLLAKLTDKINSCIQINFDKFYFWCDSTIVLSWIRRPANHWKTFVANRVATIQNLTKDINDWHHIRTYDNPADLISRGVTPSQLLQANLWWQGPEWLSKDKTEWPLVEHVETDMELPEYRNNATVLVATTNFNIFSKYSSFLKLQRVVAYCFRFKNNAKRKNIVGPLTVEELGNAVIVLAKMAQTECFKQEQKDLNQSKTVRKSSNMLKLNPFLDKEGIIRVGGRLSKSNFPYEKRHPIVLPAKHKLSELIATYEHERLLHCGPQALLSCLRDQYWPLSGRNLTRKVVHNCIDCFKANPKGIEQIMGVLPATRLSPLPPFYNCGVDYAGPFYIKDKKSRGCKTLKCYVCLFVCFATKALHLELVGDLTTEMFLAALRRFMSRRGKPSNIYSDNGTTFVGANNEMKEVFTFLNSKETLAEIRVSLNSEQINWHFIPPRSPHFGGLWEAGVKSTKAHLKRVIGNASLVYEEFNTVLIQVEAVLNSRPLSPLSSDPNDLNPITPAHFLIGRPLTAIPEQNLLDTKENRLSRFQKLQRLTQHFWSRWSKEYVSELQQRTKWKVAHPNLLKIGAMVLVREDHLPPLKWQLGRVLELHPGQDGVPRVLTIRTATRNIKRAVSKVCILPIDKE